jgi:hypothetical protein
MTDYSNITLSGKVQIGEEYNPHKHAQINNVYERRAFCMKLAIEARNFTLDPDDDDPVATLCENAKRFEAFLNDAM